METSIKYLPIRQVRDRPETASSGINNARKQELLSLNALADEEQKGEGQSFAVKEGGSCDL